jgi:hypothetical protein
MIEKSMSRFFGESPNLKYTFYGGKGGVGKTVLAGAAALWWADQGKRTLLASTNPVHSLTSMLDQDVFGKPTAVRGTSNFWAYEIDTRDTIQKSKHEIREKIEWFLKFADIKTKADEFVESATMNPAFEESAMFENMIDIMFEDEYEAYVFDTARNAQCLADDPRIGAVVFMIMGDQHAAWLGFLDPIQDSRPQMPYSGIDQHAVDEITPSRQQRRARQSHAGIAATNIAEPLF